MSSEHRYRHIASFASETPWAIIPETFSVIQEVLAARLSGERWSDAEIEARIEAAGGRRPAKQTRVTARGVAVVPLSGVLVPRANLMSDMSGGTSVQGFTDDLAAALADPDIGAVVIDVDSPGGSVSLVTEAAAQIRAMRGKKPILAVADTMMASAAYWIASQADEIAVTPSGLVGAIGVLATHIDSSGANEKLGVKPTIISAGKYKADGNPHEPLTDDAHAHLQSLVDGMYAAFTLDVSKGRGVPVDQVRSGFGEGRVLAAKDAVASGLADRVATIGETISRAASLAAAGATSGASAIATGMGIPAEIIGLEPDPPPDPDPEDVPSEAATSGLSFAAELRRTLGAVEAHVATARGFADVAEKTRLTGPKREQFEAIALSLGEAIAVRDTVVALLEETDPAKPHPGALEAVGSYLARITQTQGAVA